LAEFSTKRNSGERMTLQFHRNSQKLFQERCLLPIFETLLSCINQIINLPEVKHLLKPSLNVLESILSWDFEVCSSHIMSNANIDSDAPTRGLNLSLPWDRVVLLPDFLGLLFNILETNFQVLDISDKTMKCLIQLASIHGTIFSREGSQEAFLSMYLSHFSHYTERFMSIIDPSNPDVGDKVYNLSLIFKNIVLNFPSNLLATLPQFIGMADQLASLTIICISAGDSDIDTDAFYEASMELILVWATLLENIQNCSNHDRSGYQGDNITTPLVQKLHDVVPQIVNTYIRKRLSPNNDEQNDEIDDFEDGKDQYMYEEELIQIATLARTTPNEILSYLESEIKNIIASASYPTIFDKQGQLNWLVIFSGYILADMADGEVPSVPQAIIGTRSLNDKNNVVILVSDMFSLLDIFSFPVGSVEVSLLSFKFSTAKHHRF
jgi:hypothetical protein